MGRLQWKILLMLFSIVSLSIISGCGPKRLAEMNIQDADQCVNAVEKDGVRLCVKPIFNGEECESYYGIDILDKGYLPVELSIANHSHTPISISLASFSLDYYKHNLDPTPPNNVYEDLKASVGGRTAGWGLLFGVVGGVAAYNSAKHRNEALGSSLHTNVIEEELLKPEKHLEGVIYFKIPSKKKITAMDRNSGIILHMKAHTNDEAVTISEDVKLTEPEDD